MNGHRASPAGGNCWPAELAGGGTLFQQSANGSLGAKWVKRFDGGWSLKPRVGLRQEFFRETVDEKWGRGLYDFQRGITRLAARLVAYHASLVQEYPPFAFDMGPEDAAASATTSDTQP